MLGRWVEVTFHRDPLVVVHGDGAQTRLVNFGLAREEDCEFLAPDDDFVVFLERFHVGDLDILSDLDGCLGLCLDLGYIGVDEGLFAFKVEGSAESFNGGVKAAAASGDAVDGQLDGVWCWVGDVLHCHFQGRSIDVFLCLLWYGDIYDG